MKICSKCKIQKQSNEFYSDSKTKSKLRSSCKVCYSVVNKKASKKYRRLNKETIKLCNAGWNRKNPNYYSQTRVKLQKNAYNKTRRNTNENFRLAINLRHKVWKVLTGQTKSDTTRSLIGCSIENLKIYLESKFTKHMSWDNYGKWHIDHIKPCCIFDLTNLEDQRECFHYTNTQPLWAKDNFKKRIEDIKIKKSMQEDYK